MEAPAVPLPLHVQAQELVKRIYWMVDAGEKITEELDKIPLSEGRFGPELEMLMFFNEILSHMKKGCELHIMELEEMLTGYTFVQVESPIDIHTLYQVRMKYPGWEFKVCSEDDDELVEDLAINLGMQIGSLDESELTIPQRRRSHYYVFGLPFQPAVDMPFVHPVGASIAGGEYLSRMVWAMKMLQDCLRHDDFWLYGGRVMFFTFPAHKGPKWLSFWLDHYIERLARAIVWLGYVLISNETQAHAFVWMLGRSFARNVVGAVCESNPHLLSYTHTGITQEWNTWDDPPEVPPVLDECVLFGKFKDFPGVRHFEYSPRNTPYLP